LRERQITAVAPSITRARNTIHRFGAKASIRNPISVPTWLNTQGFAAVKSDAREERAGNQLTRRIGPISKPTVVGARSHFFGVKRQSGES